MRSKFEFASEAERRRYEYMMRRKAEKKERITIKGAEKLDPVWGLLFGLTEEQLRIEAGLQCPECFGVQTKTRPEGGYLCCECGCQWSKKVEK